jgi:RecA/RadA recombinase
MPPKKKGPVDNPAPKAHAAKKKDNNTPPSRDERAAALKEWINKKFRNKDGSVRAQLKLASEYTLPFMTKRLPTGLLSLDVELRGGFPAGGLSQVIGYRNAGKSWLYWQVIRQLQYYLADKMKVLIAMTEMRADRTQGRAAGVAVALNDEDIELLERARVKLGLAKFTKEEVASMKHEIGEIYELHGMAGEDLYDGILAAVESNAYHLIVIDSFGMIMSGAEAETESLREKTYSGAAGVTTQFLHKLSGLLTLDDEYGKARDVCIIGVNQMRDDVKDANKEYKNTGGKALEHAKFVDLLLRTGKQIGYEDNIGGKQQWQATGKEVSWEIKKGKAGIHEGGRGHWVYDFRINTADFYTDTVVAGVRYGAIEMAGAWLGIPNPNQPGTYLLRTNGKDAFVRALTEDAMTKAAAGDPNTFMNYIRNEVFKSQGIHINYEWD